MHTKTHSMATQKIASLPAIKASNIPDTNFDGSKMRSTFWLSVLAPVLMAATLTSRMLGSNFPLIAGAVCILVLFLLISKFPTNASSRFITANTRRPAHFIPTAVGLAIASALAVVSAANIEFITPIRLTSDAAGHFSALFLALAITTGGRYALNFVAMTERLTVLLICWGGSMMVDNTTLLAMGVVGLSANVLWSIQGRWTPLSVKTAIRM